MTDFARPVRRAVLPRLKGYAPLVALVPAASIYGSTVPASRTLPFLRYGVPIITPFRMSGLDASSVAPTIHAFTQGVTDDAGRLTMTAEDAVYEIGSAIRDCLDGTTLALDAMYKLRLTWLGTTPRMDPNEAGAWGTSVRFQGEVAG